MSEKLEAFREDVREANKLMARSQEVLLSLNDSKIKAFAGEVVRSRAALMLKAHQLIVSGEDEKAVLAAAEEFDSSPIQDVTAYLAALKAVGPKPKFPTREVVTGLVGAGVGLLIILVSLYFMVWK